jgi:hypothetical protein
MVKAADVLTFLEGKKPESFATLTIKKLLAAKKLAKFD